MRSVGIVAFGISSRSELRSAPSSLWGGAHRERGAVVHHAQSKERVRSKLRTTGIAPAIFLS